MLIQSSAAIQTKEWMRACYREGIVPLLQMHDSFDLSVASPDVAEMVARLGEEVIKLEVPMKVDVKYGRTWGDAQHTWAGLHAETGLRVELAGELHGDRDRTQRESRKFSSVSDKAPPWEGAAQFIELPKNKGDTAARGDGFNNFTTDVEGYDYGKICCPFHDEKTPSCQL